MFAAIVLLLVILALFGVGLAVKAAVWLLWLAAILTLVWLVGWFIGSGEQAARRSWYRW